MHLELIIFDISIVITLFSIVVFCLSSSIDKGTFIKKNKYLISSIDRLVLYVTMVGQIYNDFISMRKGNFKVFQGKFYAYTSSMGVGIVILENI